MSADPSFGDEPQIYNLDQMFRVGYDRLYAGDHAGAGLAFRAAVIVDPANGEAWSALAEAEGAQSPAGRPPPVSGAPSRLSRETGHGGRCLPMPCGSAAK